MNKLLLVFLLSISSLVASSQKVYFIYLQAESEQPFYIKMNDKVQSSSASGYLILSKLHDSTYSFSIGFPQGKWPEMNYSVTMNKKDHGFLIKNFGEKGWGLFNLQTLAIQMPSSGVAALPEAGKTETKEVSAFTEMLSKAADDPSLKEKSVQPKVEEKKAEVVVAETEKVQPVAKLAEVPLVEKKEEVVAPKPLEVIAVDKKEETVSVKPAEIIEEKKEIVRTEQVEEYKMSAITKRSESSTTEGFGLVYIDSYPSGAYDTIRLLIPNPKPAVPVIKETPKEDRKMLDMPVEVVIKPEEKAVETKPVVEEVKTIAPVSKKGCAEIATEADFFKLRKAMAAVETDDDMIREANNYFKAKCFVTAQIKNLGALFLTDEGKYKFFDAAYIRSADPENFSSLQTELKDEYFINRFRAMLRN
jgi:hypothetical protein